MTRCRPKVWSTKELEAAKRTAQFKMYEAVPSTSTGKKAPVPTEMDVEIDKFLPLLKDYLNGERLLLERCALLSSALLNIVSDLAPPSPAKSLKGAKDADGMDEDYVYDVFYHRPATDKGLYDPTSSNIAKLYVYVLPSSIRCVRANVAPTRIALAFPPSSAAS